MKKIVATGIVLVSLVGFVPGTARAGGATDAALALGAFAVFNQIVAGIGLFGRPYAYAAAPAYYPGYAYAPPVYAAAAPRYYYDAAPAPVRNEVVYPHGKYVLQGDGVTVAYQWTWVPSVSGPPPTVLNAPLQSR